eukprot:CAMPEP_0180321400 /NCGR_PEP_ID=MMETSP0988-20121125/36121_1 /TAXON_ID=697907 /ORGANISM="non described non described, Strain CCMP2293" /LENGTH=41 /DNA_ID= /DNA_START= /DNA_END= /DNA_ORIENTATION=
MPLRPRGPEADAKAEEEAQRLGAQRFGAQVDATLAARPRPL